SLQRCVAPRAAQRAHLAIRGIKSGHRGVGTSAPPFDIESAAVAVLTFARFPIERAAESRTQALRRLWGPDRRSIHLRAKQSTDSERLIAHDLSRGAKTGAARQQSIIWITFRQLRSHP